MEDVSKRAIRADPDDPMAWLLRGNALSLQWRRDEALEANAVALRIDPYLCAALQDQAGLIYGNGKAPEGVAIARKSPGRKLAR